ncbi:protein O-mannosyl-transferase TMTC1 [Papilio machaon]|uniref:protein O-mannosyl-transferase TMTC1 n=1 Tax=Papilio machaon TaxID=76193 RepID=UPI001E6658A4|nr:protein O-mannosyl-transferase TMTC1 [Papilio machaon]
MRRKPLPSVREENSNPKTWRSICESDWAVYTIVASVGALTYANSLHGEFVHDDIPAIVSNGDVTGANPLLQVFRNDFWGTPMSEPSSHKSYRPLTTLTFRLNYLLCGFSVWWWHLGNVCLHAACCALVARAGAVVARLQRPFAALAALLFAVHPIHTEAVSGVVGRADVLACVLFLSSLLVYHGSSRQRVWASAGLAALSMLAKETGLTALLFNILFDIFRCWGTITRCGLGRCRWRGEGQGEGIRGRVARAAGVLAVAAALRLCVLHGALPAFSPQDNPPAFHPSFLVRLMTFSYLAAFNWWLVLCPWSLSHDWQLGSVPLVTSITDPRNAVTLLALASLVALFYCALTDIEAQRRTPAAAGLLLLVLPYLPASNLLVTVGFVVAERVLYIPSIGSIIITAYGLQVLWRRFGRARRLLALGAAVLVASGAARTQLRNCDWRTRETLLRADLSVLPHNAKLHYNFANFLKDIEQQESAIKHYKEALKLWPSYASAHNNLGTLVVASGRAEYHFMQALKYNRHHLNAHYNLAKLYRKKNRISDSLKMLERCIELEPRFVQAYLELLLVTPLADKRGILDKLLELEPRNWEHHHMYGNWLKERGLWPLALQYYMSSLRLSVSAAPSVPAVPGARPRPGAPPAPATPPSLRSACLLLRSAGQHARILQLIDRWVSLRSDEASMARRWALARAWRLRTELAGRAAKYARSPTVKPTCLHHSKLEVLESSHKFNGIRDDSSTFLYKHDINSVKHREEEGKTSAVNSCQRNLLNDNKKDVAVSAQYKPIHNKSETNHKHKSCRLHKKKKIKEPASFAPFVSDHFIKTY